MFEVDNVSCSRKLCIFTNSNCNLRCTYCYENKTEESSFDFDNIKHQLDIILKEPTEHGTLIKLHGGEPFLVFKQIQDLCEFLWQHNYPEKYIIHTTTNGTLIRGTIQKWLQANKHRFSIKLSIDGKKESHNRNRPGSFDKIDFAFFLRNWPNIVIKMTISPTSIMNFSENVIFLHELGFKNIQPSFAEMVKWQEKGIGRIFFKEMNKLSSYYLEHPEIKPCTFFKVPFENIFINKENSHPCTIGTKKAYDLNTGKKYPCHLFFESVCGKKKSEELSSIDFSKKELLTNHLCSKCPFSKICRTCYAANYIVRGDVAARDEWLCLFNRCRYRAVAQYEFNLATQKIFSEKNDIEKKHTYRKIQAIKVLFPFFERIEKDPKW